MNPKLGRTIYVVYKGSITQSSVYMKGSVSFAHAEAFDSMYVDDYRDELYYEDYNKTWFTSLPKAKKFLLKEHPDCVVVGGEDGYWELEYKPDKSYRRSSL